MLGRFIARGRTSEIYSWEDDKVLKLFYDFIPIDAVENEFEKTSIISNFTDLCPKIYERISLPEGEGIIYENIRGKSITYNLLNRPLKVKELSIIMADAHAEIHTIAPIGFPGIKDNILAGIENSSRLDSKRKKRLMDILEAMEEGESLCHMDYHPENIFLTDRGPRIIDWMNSGKGNPIADVARTIVILRYSSLPFQNPVFRGVIRLSREILIKEYMEAYFKGSRPDVNLDKWMLLVAAARTSERLPESEIEKLMDFVCHEIN